MGKATIWHNPRCGKSRNTLALVQESGHEVEIIKYLETTPSAAEIETVLALLGLEPRELMRKKEAPFKELRLADASHSRSDLIEAMVAHPILIERPVVLYGGKAVIGRPPENVLGIL